MGFSLLGGAETGSMRSSSLVAWQRMDDDLGREGRPTQPYHVRSSREKMMTIHKARRSILFLRYAVLSALRRCTSRLSSLNCALLWCRSCLVDDLEIRSAPLHGSFYRARAGHSSIVKTPLSLQSLPFIGDLGWTQDCAGGQYNTVFSVPVEQRVSINIFPTIDIFHTTAISAKKRLDDVFGYHRGTKGIHETPVNACLRCCNPMLYPTCPISVINEKH